MFDLDAEIEDYLGKYEKAPFEFQLAGKTWVALDPPDSRTTTKVRLEGDDNAFAQMLGKKQYAELLALDTPLPARSLGRLYQAWINHSIKQQAPELEEGKESTSPQ